MALYNRGKKIMSDGSSVVWTSTDVRVLLVTSGYTFDVDHNTVSQITNELSGGNYVRKSIASPTMTEDDTDNRMEFDAADITWTALGAAAGTPAAAIVYKYNAADASAELIAYVPLTSPFVPNGGDYSVVWDDSGVFYLA